jgi:diguanylate cyclase (GGDEF)-like protein
MPIHSFRQLVAWLAPGPKQSDTLFVAIGLITSVFTFSYIGISALIGFTIGVILQSICFALLLATIAFFSRSGHYRFCTHLFLANCFFISILGCSFFSGGIHSMVTPWFVLVPLVSVLLHSAFVDNLVWGILAAAAVLVYGAAAMAGLDFPLLYDESMRAFFNALCISGLLICLSWIAFIFGQNRKRALATISQQKETLERALAEIELLAFHDMLTQLPNRRLFLDRLRQARAESRRKECYAALMFIDLDNFKSLNDHHGHDAGDVLLVQVAQRLKSCLRQTDTIARFGGDEFAVLLGCLDRDFESSRQDALAVANKIVGALAQPYQLEVVRGNRTPCQIEHHSTASVGIVIFFGQTENERDLLIAVDEAMYDAKAAGGNGAHLFIPTCPI